MISDLDIEHCLSRGIAKDNLEQHLKELDRCQHGLKRDGQ
jgi:hypothetical protein